jgi:hypothetical protein
MAISKRAELALIAVAFLLIGLAIVGVVRVWEPRDLGKECQAQCHPRFSRVVPDPKYPPPVSGKLPFLICECY